jgi:DNA-binding transcriptional MerR regulator
MPRPNSVLRARRALQGDLDSIDQDEAAAIIGKSTKTLQRWRSIGYGPPFELDSRYVTYSKASVQTWAAQRNWRRTPTEEFRRAVIFQT